MTRAQLALIGHGVLAIAAMAGIVPALTGFVGLQAGYLLSLSLYWLGFCLPVLVLHVRPQADDRLFSEKLAWRDWFVPILLLVQVGVVAVVLFAPNTAMLTTHAAMLAAVVGLVGGVLEEAAWRGGFMVRFEDRPRLGFWLGWLLSTASQVPLLFSRGLVLDQGWALLIIGAAALGLLWSWIAWRTGSVFWVSIAHVLTSILGFWVLFERNGFA